MKRPTRRIAGAVLGTVLVLAGASPAVAGVRANDTITVTCEPTGFTYYPDANALAGQTIANDVYNVVNPLGETCIAFYSDDEG
jgi:hypothetical protein